MEAPAHNNDKTAVFRPGRFLCQCVCDKNDGNEKLMAGAAVPGVRRQRWQKASTAARSTVRRDSGSTKPSSAIQKSIINMYFITEGHKMQGDKLLFFQLVIY